MTGSDAAYFYDAIAGLPITVGTNFKQKASDDNAKYGGFVLETDGATRGSATNFLTANQTSVPPSDNSLCTLVARVKLTTKPASFGSIVQWGTSAGHGPFIGFTSNGYAFGGCGGSNGAGAAAVDAIDHLNEWITLGGAWDNNGSVIWNVFVNGVKTTSAGGEGTKNTTAITTLSTGKETANYNNFIAGQIGFIMGFSKVLTDAEHIELARNPWALLAPVIDTTFFSLPDTGGGGISLTIDYPFGMEFGSGIQANITGPAGSDSGIEVANAAAEETGSALAGQVSALVEPGAGIAVTVNGPEEAGAGIRADLSPLAAFLSGLTADLLAQGESGALLRQDSGAAPLDFASVVSAITNGLAEFGLVIGCTITVPVEFGGSANAIIVDIGPAVEWQGSVARALAAPEESGAGLAASISLAAAVSASLTCDASTPADTVASIRRDIAAAVEELAGLARTQAAPVAFLATLASGGVIVVEFDGSAKPLVSITVRLLVGAGSTTVKAPSAETQVRALVDIL